MNPNPNHRIRPLPNLFSNNIIIQAVLIWKYNLLLLSLTLFQFLTFRSFLFQIFLIGNRWLEFIGSCREDHLFVAIRIGWIQLACDLHILLALSSLERYLNLWLFLLDPNLQITLLLVLRTFSIGHSTSANHESRPVTSRLLVLWAYGCARLLRFWLGVNTIDALPALGCL